jgi:hypothetical protein
MTLDDLLNAPLAPVHDDGFSARLLLRLERTRQRQVTLLWCMIAAAIMPVLLAVIWFLPLEQFTPLVSGGLETALASPFLPPVAGMLVLFWAWQTRVLRF